MGRSHITAPDRRFRQRIGKLLGDARRQAGLSQEALAKRLRCHRVTVAHIEGGNGGGLSIEHISRIAKATGADPGALLREAMQ